MSHAILLSRALDIAYTHAALDDKPIELEELADDCLPL